MKINSFPKNHMKNINNSNNKVNNLILKKELKIRIMKKIL